MNFKSQGLLISILILISLILICHTVNFLYPKHQTHHTYNTHQSQNKNLNNFLNLAIPNITTPVEYNQIYYDKQALKIPCNQSKEAQIPCNVVSSCTNTTPQIPITTQYQLSDSELNILYRSLYADAGRQVLYKTLVK